MVRLTCANEFCLYSFRDDEEDAEEFPYCQWCLERKMKVRLSLGVERDKAVRELRQPWKGYRYKNMPDAIVEKLRQANAALAAPDAMVSPTVPFSRPQIGRAHV